MDHSSSEITPQLYLHSLSADRNTAAEKLEAHLIGPKSDPSFDFGTLMLPGSIGAEEVVGRGEEI